MSKQIGNSIKECRIKLGIPLRELARKAKLAHSHLRKIEDNITKPSVSLLIRILDSLNAPNSIRMSLLGSPRDIMQSILVESGVHFVHGYDTDKFSINIGAGKELHIKLLNE